MKVSGFTFVRNAVQYDYPIVEAINSILPLCTEVVVAVGNSTDETLALIQSINNEKIKIIETTWDESAREGGRALAIETDKAFSAIRQDADWAFYIQGDEVLHEKYIPSIQKAMEKYLQQPDVDGLLFHYLHFYGSYNFVGTASNWYPFEIRIIRNNPAIYSYRDAQGFRKNNDKKLNVKLIDAYIYHYGWVKNPRAMQEKQITFQKLWHDDEEAARRVGKNEIYQYEKNIQSLARFTGTHPEVMRYHIAKKNWAFQYDASKHRLSAKEKIKSFLRDYLGLDFSYKNYRLLK